MTFFWLHLEWFLLITTVITDKSDLKSLKMSLSTFQTAFDRCEFDCCEAVRSGKGIRRRRLIFQQQTHWKWWFLGTGSQKYTIASISRQRNIKINSVEAVIWCSESTGCKCDNVRVFLPYNGNLPTNNSRYIKDPDESNRFFSRNAKITNRWPLRKRSYAFPL